MVISIEEEGVDGAATRLRSRDIFPEYRRQRPGTLPELREPPRAHPLPPVGRQRQWGVSVRFLPLPFLANLSTSRAMFRAGDSLRSL